MYNVSVYANNSVGSAANRPSGMHNLTVLTYETVLFDYAIYTYVLVGSHSIMVPHIVYAEPRWIPQMDHPHLCLCHHRHRHR